MNAIAVANIKLQKEIALYISEQTRVQTCTTW
jgi:hypothetical protein